VLFECDSASSMVLRGPKLTNSKADGRLTKGFFRLLREGMLRFDSAERRLEIVDTSGFVRHCWTYDKLRAENCWGQVYEIFVGNVFELRGYGVTYRGATMGFLDRGVDLVASKDAETLYIQCKHGRMIGRQRIEQMLYAASSYLSSQYTGELLEFRVAVPSISRAFGRRKERGGVARIDLAWLKYLMSKNRQQRKVHIQVLELPMPECSIE
jgi:Restriction endonuclease